MSLPTNFTVFMSLDHLGSSIVTIAAKYLNISELYLYLNITETLLSRFEFSWKCLYLEVGLSSSYFKIH